MAGHSEKTWLDLRDQEWQENRHKWNFQINHYDSQQALDKAFQHAKNLQQYAGSEFQVKTVKEDDEVKVNQISPNVELDDRYPGLYQTYLPLKPRERISQYVDRVATSDPVDHMYRIVNTIVGILSSAEADANRTWQEENEDIGLENHSTGDVASRMQDNADTSRTNWLDKWEEVLRQLLIFDKTYVLVEGLSEDGNDDAKVKTIDPRNVVNKRHDDGRLVEVLVRNTQTVQAPLREGEGQRTEEIYILYDLEGWQKYRKQEDTVIPVTEKQEYEFYETADREQPRLPIIEVEHDLPTSFGLRLAKRTNTIFQKISERDHAQRTMHTNMFVVDTEDDAFRNIRRTVAQNGSLIQGDGGFENPSSEPVDSANQVIQEKVEGLYVDFFLDYGNSGVQKTATEIRQDFQTGLEALLQILATSLDKAESEALFLIEQIYFPENPSVWGQADVERTTDFQPEDPAKMAEQILSNLFPVDGPPMTPEIKARLASKVYDWVGIDHNVEDLLQSTTSQRRAEDRQALQAEAFDEDLQQPEEGVPQ
jgi:hypothetical protein